MPANVWAGRLRARAKTQQQAGVDATDTRSDSSSLPDLTPSPERDVIMAEATVLQPANTISADELRTIRSKLTV